MGATPGPWEAHDLEVSSTHGPAICRLYDANDFPCLEEPDDQAAMEAEQVANAYLIAGAPDLYEALRMMVADFGDYPASERPCLAFDLAFAALAKANPASLAQPNGPADPAAYEALRVEREWKS